MLRQHFQEVLNCLDNREILEVFTKVKHVDRPIIRRIVTKTLVKPSERSPPLPSTDSNSSRGQAKLSSPTASMQSKKSGQKNMQKVSNTGGDQQRKPANTSSSGMLRVPSTGRPSSKQTMKTAVARDDLETCKYCSRRFATDRLQVHEDICARTGKKKRKTYDATKHRLQGTELEPYTRRTQKSASKPAAKGPAKKGDWRRMHEEFISAIRAAKMAQAHIAKGGKLSELPPPPPSSNPDYVQCPHCGRRFNEAAAERHIPKCASYDFNKPKAGGKAFGQVSRTSARPPAKGPYGAFR